MNLTDHHIAWLRLTFTQGLSNAAIRKLVRAFETPMAVLAAPTALIAERMGPQVAAALAAPAIPSHLDRATAWLSRPANWMVAWRDPEYPALLGDGTADPPPVLYGTGHQALLGAASLAMVGSRNATAQGLRDAEDFARYLSDAGLAIVSGLALGIDAAAHRGGLAGASSSIAVLGTGADVIYPRRNTQLYEALSHEGAIISEFPLGTVAARENFPRRNRVISGLSKGTLVVEAAPESGSLITARCAGEQGRDVFAIPGSIHSPQSKGTHALLRDGAGLVERAEDILFALKMAAPSPQPGFASWSDRDDPLLRALGPSTASMEELARRVGASISELAGRISELELRGRVAVLPGARVQRLHGPDADTL